MAEVRAEIAPYLEAVINKSMPIMERALQSAFENSGKMHSDDVRAMFMAMQDSTRVGDMPRAFDEAATHVTNTAIEATLRALQQTNSLMTPVPGRD